MRKKYLFCTRLRIYLTELPVMILFALACYYNKKSEEVFKLYPLIIFLGIAMIFIFVYFFRAISLSFEEVRYHGLYSSRDHASIIKDNELIITMAKKKRLRVDLFGNDGRAPELDYIKNDENYKPIDIYMFRGKAIGGKRQVASILKYYGVSESDIPNVFIEPAYSGNYEYVTLKSEIGEDKTVIRLKFKETV